MLEEIRPAVALTVLMTLLLGFAYPGVSTLLIKIAFPHQAEGSMVVVNGETFGSVLIGQNFTDPKYFWSRLSATSPQAYNAASSSGSNFGAANPALLDAVKGRMDALKAADPANKAAVPVDLVTASASGLDPHISPAAADYQIARVAKARGMDENHVRQLVAQHTESRQFGILGEPVVNVLMLNLALDGKI
jgi:K+-transporting ATPase ATPase C chain